MLASPAPRRPRTAIPTDTHLSITAHTLPSCPCTPLNQDFAARTNEESDPSSRETQMPRQAASPQPHPQHSDKHAGRHRVNRETRRTSALTFGEPESPEISPRLPNREARLTTGGTPARPAAPSGTMPPCPPRPGRAFRGSATAALAASEG
ncbi:hypothetical protein TRAPUB_3635 [Trametes pubescens]|uniref:Uncharacterized protein n=1 Tax=Trametes pubescens TaxID=154538 RepID=A0A1M2VDD5_TRAPU|nr:hypothetical protein TRAPUB_3635 [Trametes pubescens]